MNETPVIGPALESLVAATLHSLRGEAVAIGAAVDDVTTSLWRGHISGQPVDGHTAFYGASVTKQVIGIAAARAVTAGRMTVADPVLQWLPELPASMGTIRLRHLLHHTSGLPDVADPALGTPNSNAEVIERFRTMRLPHLEPGLRYAYNNAGYVLLAEAVGRSLQRPIGEVADELFSHLDLSDTRVGGPAVPLDGRPDPPGTIGDGGLWTSISDLTRWLQACNATAFGADVQRLTESATTLADGSPLDYAWGIRLTDSPAGPVITHGGSWDTWLAKTVRIPTRRIAVAILSVGASDIEISRAGVDLATEVASLRPRAGRAGTAGSRSL